MRVENKLITDENVFVDQNEYINCVFERCRIIFTGKGPARFSGCRFILCEWVFDGAAEETIQYLAALYNGMGTGGADLVEGVFESIRKGGAVPETLEPISREELLRR